MRRWSLFITVMMLATGCGKKEKAAAGSTQQETAVSAYTSGVISRESPIRVLFVATVISDAAKLNVPVDNPPISFKPAIKGTAIWTNGATLEFRPAERLTAGTEYKATLRLGDLVPDAAQKFEFSFTAMKQSFELLQEGLRSVSSDNLKIQQFIASIVTTDAELSPDVEKMISATQKGSKRSVRWEHSADRRNHRFTIDSIARGDDSSSVEFTWNGAPIGVDRSGRETVAIPPLQQFTVTSARAVQGDETYIEVRFSDPLDKTQSLSGLIQAGKRDLRFSIEDNIVKVYSTSGWSGNYTVKVSKGVRNSMRQPIRKEETFDVRFEIIVPQVRFIGSGAIIPTSQGQTVPIEAVNLRAVIVEATRIYESTMPQFLQINTLAGESELKRVGRIIWKKVVPIDPAGEHINEWIKCGLDVGPLIADNPGGLYRLSLTFKRHHINYRCSDTVAMPLDETFDVNEENDPPKVAQTREASSWDSYEENASEEGEASSDEGEESDGEGDGSGEGEDGGEGEGENVSTDEGDYGGNGSDPCESAFYRRISRQTMPVTRNVLISDIGIIAKKGDGDTMYVVTTDLKSAGPLSNATVTLLDYQEQVLATGKTDRNGAAALYALHRPFLVVAANGGQKGYLKIEEGTALPVSHFDVQGEEVQKGLKGFIYGERGVWRPGDTLFLCFILHDPEHRLPADHPVQFTLTDARNHEVVSQKSRNAVNGFYRFTVSTDPGAPTGNWIAKIRAGGAVFEKTLSVETVMPNRLKVNFDLGKTALVHGEKAAAKFSSQWLHGAPAKNLNADVKLTLASAPTVFKQWSEFSFSDPSASFQSEPVTLFESQLDEKGNAEVDIDISAPPRAPGFLTAQFAMRVFEPGGSFSSGQFSVPYYPYDRYIGVRLPKGDKARGMLLTDTAHTANIVAVDEKGALAGSAKVVAKLYKVDWRWWWEKGAESVADYAATSSYTVLKCDTVQLNNGQGTWNFRVNYPDWGRYLVAVYDLKGGHSTGKVVYIDWPGWAGRAQKDMKVGANVCNFTADKSEYLVGEKAVITIPTAKKGRGCISIEKGGRVLRQEWLTGEGETAQHQLNITSAMAPGVYVSVTYLQPHLTAGNDVPLRTYGVIPINVVDPASKLAPQIAMPEVLQPGQTAKIAISEASGKPMTYTLAIVDEGLLDLTRFRTPDPHGHFFKREALGVKTWDMFDLVAGAYGATLEKLLSIGGDGEAEPEPAGGKEANRFPPMVRFYGPFALAKGETADHEIAMPQYVGSVRVMVVAGQNGAFGSGEKTVPVRKPLMLLPTLPRVLSIQEEAVLPVSVFALEPKVKEVTVTITASGPLAITGESKVSRSIAAPGDDIVNFKAKAKNRVGVAEVKVKATGGGESAEQTIQIAIRNPSDEVTDVIDAVLEPKKSWKNTIKLPGITGSNRAVVEVSSIVPINLEKRLSFLIQYPHGCVEQTTSSVFPQLYLGKLLDLPEDQKRRIEKNIKAGIDRLRKFQTPDGGFGYWPGESYGNEWGSCYAGHFLVETQKAGYTVPENVMKQWVYYQQAKAREWVTGSDDGALNQAYRLYTLALSGNPDLGSMNRLREQNDVGIAEKWRLAAAYQLAGQQQTAVDMVRGLSTNIKKYRDLSGTFGSDIRDKAMILEAISLVNVPVKSQGLVKDLSEALGKSDEWLGTQTTAYALIALARYSGITGKKDNIKVAIAWSGRKKENHVSDLPVVQLPLAVDQETAGELEVTNTGSQTAYVRIITSGAPEMGTEKSASNGLALSIDYTDEKGNAIGDISTIEQGQDIVAHVTISNTGDRNYEEVALSHFIASGFEIHNNRLSPGGGTDGYEYRDIRDDRVYTYFDLPQGETLRFTVLCNASYCGSFYLPMAYVEAMYDATINARVPGQWISVVKPGVGE